MASTQTTQHTTTWQIADGMTVYGTDGEKLGTVRNYAPQHGYLDIQKGRLFHKDFYVPLTAVERVDEEGIALRLAKQDLDDDRYATRPTAGGTVYGEGFVTTDSSLSDQRQPFEERREVTVTRMVGSEPVH